MATTTYFEETIHDQGGKSKMDVEFGRSSYYANSSTPNGIGQDSIYLTINGHTVIMDRATAKRFVEAAVSVGQYHRLIE